MSFKQSNITQMTKEEKQLLLKDLCGRLPYGAFVQFEVDGQKTIKPLTMDFLSSTWYHTEWIKPYLRPMSSMTEEEKGELWFLLSEGRTNIEVNSNGQLTTRDNIELGFNYPFVCPQGSSLYVDWLNEHHFDYRGLIPMGLALEAPKDMYNI